MYKSHPIMKEMKFKVRDRIEELSKNYSNEELEGFKGAYFSKDKLLIIAGENHYDINDVRETIKHELYGHAGTYMITKENKKELIESIKNLESEPSVKKIWDFVKKEYPQAKKDIQAEEVFSYISEKDTDKYTLVGDVSFNVQSLQDIKKISNYVKNEIHSGRAKFHFIPEKNNLQFKKNNPKIQKFINKIKSERVKKISIKDKSLGFER